MSIIPNIRLSSTTYPVEEVKIRRPRRAQSDRVSEANSLSQPRRGWRGLSRLDWRRPVGVRLSYVSGSHPRVKVEARGREWLYDWDVALLDVLSDVANRGSHGIERKYGES